MSFCLVRLSRFELFSTRLLSDGNSSLEVIPHRRLGANKKSTRTGRTTFHNSSHTAVTRCTLQCTNGTGIHNCVRVLPDCDKKCEFHKRRQYFLSDSATINTWKPIKTTLSRVSEMEVHATAYSSESVAPKFIPHGVCQTVIPVLKQFLIGDRTHRSIANIHN